MTKKKRVKQSASHPTKSPTDLLLRLEKEAEKVVARLRLQAERSSRELKKTVKELVRQIQKGGLPDLGGRAAEVLHRAREIEFGSFNRDKLIREAKKNLGDLVESLQSTDLFARAKDRAEQTKDHVLNVLSIPSQTEVAKLSRKIDALETRMKKLGRKAA